jgi:16S rRNA (cytosine1402-N4)-methyltransferase
MSMQLVGNRITVSRRVPNDQMSEHARATTAFSGHVPVLLEEAVAALNLAPGAVIVDGTFGGGGHARVILDHIKPGGRLIAFDRDAEAAQRAELLAREFPDAMTFVHASFATMRDTLNTLGIESVAGILLDLGLSSLQLADAERGFAFSADGPLDMRFDQTRGESAAQLIGRATEQELTELLWRYSDERNARRIARAIMRARAAAPITMTGQLAEIVSRAIGGRRGAPTHPATQTFQALRIAVNDELGELERGLQAVLESLAPSGRLVVIAFHSLEDRLVKQFLALEARGCVCPPELPVCVCGRLPRVRLVGRAVRATPSEIAANPRARSAIMRVAERLP